MLSCCRASVFKAKKTILTGREYFSWGCPLSKPWNFPRFFQQFCIGKASGGVVGRKATSSKTQDHTYLILFAIWFTQSEKTNCRSSSHCWGEALLELQEQLHRTCVALFQKDSISMRGGWWNVCKYLISDSFERSQDDLKVAEANNRQQQPQGAPLFTRCKVIAWMNVLYVSKEASFL